MATFRVSLNLRFGRFDVEFENEQELRERLSELRNYASLVQRETSDLVVWTGQEGDPYADLRHVSADARLRLLKVPKNKGDAVRLAVFLAPEPPTFTQIVDYTGVSNPVAYVKKGELVKDPSGRYSLEASAREYVVNRLITRMRASQG